MLFINGAAGNVAPIYSGYADLGAAHHPVQRVLGDRFWRQIADCRDDRDINLDRPEGYRDATKPDWAG